MIDTISLYIIPILILFIVVYAYLKDVAIYSSFVEGAKRGFKTSIGLIPYLIAIFVAIGVFRASNALEMFTRLLSPITDFLGIPKEVLPLIFIRPISGSGALGVVRDTIGAYGPDSYIGVLASVLMGSSETIFYTLAIYYGAVGIKDYRHTIKAAMLSYILSIFTTIYIVRMFYY